MARDSGLDVAVARNQDDLRIDLPFAQPRERRQAVHSRQPDIQDDQIDRSARDALETRLAARHRLDAVAFIAQHTAQRAAHARFVVDDEDCWLHVRGQIGCGLRASGFRLRTVPIGLQLTRVFCRSRKPGARNLMPEARL